MPVLPPVVSIDDSFGNGGYICINTAIIETSITTPDIWGEEGTIELNLFDLNRLIEVLTVSRDYMKGRQS